MSLSHLRPLHCIFTKFVVWLLRYNNFNFRIVVLQIRRFQRTLKHFFSLKWILKMIDDPSNFLTLLRIIFEWTKKCWIVWWAFIEVFTPFREMCGVFLEGHSYLQKYLFLQNCTHSAKQTLSGTFLHKLKSRNCSHIKRKKFKNKL